MKRLRALGASGTGPAPVPETNMDPFFLWLEATAFSTWLRESPSVFAFPAVLALHTIGLALAVGVNVALDLRILGVGDGGPVAELRRFLPLMWAGLWLNVATGVALLIAYPAKALTNPVFYAKLLLIGTALMLMRLICRSAFAAPSAAPAPRPKALAVASLACWAAAIAAGRLLAYTHSRLLASF